jgi:hypothetical protein
MTPAISPARLRHKRVTEISLADQSVTSKEKPDNWPNVLAALDSGDGSVVESHADLI